MKRFTNYILLVSVMGLLLVLTACPYASKVPIDKAGVKFDRNLLGKWKKYSNSESKHPEYFEIADIDGNQFNINKFEYSSSDSSYNKSVYLAHISKIGDYLFLNMQKGGEGDYFLHRIDLNGNTFKLYEVTDNIDETFNTSEELRDFIKKNMHLSFFYNKDEKLYIKEK